MTDAKTPNKIDLVNKSTPLKSKTLPDGESETKFVYFLSFFARGKTERRAAERGD